jgi:hypothetical protein
MVLDRAVIMNWIYLITGLAILIGALYYYFGGGARLTASAMSTGPTALTGAVEILKSEDAALFYTKPEGSFQGFFYLNAMNRTGTYSTCGTNPNQASCTDGTFAPCPCGGGSRNDCSVCKHVGYEPLISIAGVATVEVLTVPDASRQGKAMAQLVLKTEGPAPTTAGQSSTGRQTYMETISLPYIPMQKWIMLTICREGRRYDVYYDKALVVSKKTMYMPVTETINSNLKGVISGSEALTGEVALVDLENRLYTMGEVASAFGRKADTRGAPRVSSSFTAGYRDSAGLMPNYSGSIFGTVGSALPTVNMCFGGTCFNAPAVRPASSIYDWTTSYA